MTINVTIHQTINVPESYHDRMIRQSQWEALVWEMEEEKKMLAEFEEEQKNGKRKTRWGLIALTVTTVFTILVTALIISAPTMHTVL